jgi:UDP-glucose 4-epimerase
MKVYVTGGGGFIGSVVANKLDDAGHTVVAIDNEFLGVEDNLNESVEYRRKSITERLELNDVDTIYHLAGLSSLSLCRDNAYESANVNVAGTVNLFETAMCSGVDNIIQASTSSVYGTVYEPVSENAPVTAKTLYEASKLSQEQYANAYEEKSDLTIASVRPASIYQGMGYNERHKSGNSSVVSLFAEIFHNREQPTIYGDGSQQRDFLHVDDAANGFISATGLSGVYNIGTGKVTSINKVVELIREKMSLKIKAEYIENPIEEEYIERSQLDSSKLESHTGWEPTISINEGIGKLCEFYK